MITISSALEDAIKNRPFLEEGLASGIINFSALARRLKPELERRLYRKMTDASVIMALQRMRPRIKRMSKAGLKELKSLKNLTVRSNLVEYVFYNSPALVPLQKKLLEIIEKRKDSFVNLLQGAAETTIIASRNLQPQIETIIPKHLRISRIEALGSITLTMSPSQVYVPGVYYNLLKALAWENLNVMEAVSGYDEITLVFEEKNIQKAFACIKQLTA